MWNVDQYHRFQQERSQPAYDLMDFIGARSNMRIVDLGCGPGDHTKTLHERYRAAETIGIDKSAEMLEKAPRAPNLVFKLEDIHEFRAESSFDLVFSNAALQWVPDHETIFSNLYQALRPGGQLAVQVPKNGDHISQRVAYLIEKEAPYNSYPPNLIEKNTLAPEEYAVLLTKLGFKSVKVRMFVYIHRLESSADVAEWMKGSLLTHYASVMPKPTYENFEAEYRKRVVGSLPAESPYLYTFKRILMHAVK